MVNNSWLTVYGLPFTVYGCQVRNVKLFFNFQFSIDFLLVYEEKSLSARESFFRLVWE